MNKQQIQEYLPQFTKLPTSVIEDFARGIVTVVVHTPYGDKRKELETIDTYTSQEGYYVPGQIETRQGLFSSYENRQDGVSVPPVKKKLTRRTTMDELVAFLQEVENETAGIFFKNWYQHLNQK